MNSDQNMLFGILALQMDFVTRDALIAAMNAWVLDKSKPLAEFLLERKAIGKDERSLLDSLVKKHIERHGNDPSKSLAAVQSPRDLRTELQKISDVELQASLSQLIATREMPDPMVTLDAKDVGPATSSGLRFSLLYAHAKGGLGEIFVARDEELKRRVALKQIQLGQADKTDSRSRFVLEAEITGGLEHPGIVPVYGLGKWPDGRPYYAMRFIRGDTLEQAIKQFHRTDRPERSPGERRLELRQLLGRFVDVCDALEYAHSRGVLHRDLKPANIMLGKYGETLVVDWGLAEPVENLSSISKDEEALMPSTFSGSSRIRSGSLIGTPPYMSPEQAQGLLDQMGPTSDVYSLGATLYQILTGAPPFKEPSVTATLEKVRRGEFVRPRQIAPWVEVPLEAIALKAMALKPADRYASSRSLADDVEHYLADEPVSAYQETRAEQFSRWMRRHRALVRSTVGALLAIAVAAVLAAVLINSARRREATAHAESERSFLQARQAVDDFFTHVSESKLLNVPNLQPLRGELLRSALDYYQAFVQQRAEDPSVRRELAATYYRIGLIQSQIGEKGQVLPALSQAESIQEKLAAADPSDPELRYDLSNTLNAEGDAQHQQGHFELALARFESARKLRTKLASEHPDQARYARKLANSHDNIAMMQSALDHNDQALNDHRQAIDIRTELAAKHPEALQFQSDLARGWYNFGRQQRKAGDWAAARKSFQQAIDLFTKLVDKDTKVIDYQRELAITLREMGDLEAESGQLDAARRSYDEARTLAERLTRQNPFLIELQADVASLYMNIGRFDRQTGALDQALARFQEAAVVQEQLVASEPSAVRFRRDLADSRLQIGIVQFTTDDLPGARASFDAALNAYKAMATEHPDDRGLQDAIAQAHTDLALVERWEHKPQQALAQFENVAAVYRKLLAAGESVHAQFGLADALLNCAVEQRTLGHSDEALKVLDDAERQLIDLSAAHPLVPEYRHTLAEIDYLCALIYLERNDLPRAEDSYRRLKVAQERLVAEVPDNPDYQNRLGATLDELAVVLFQRDKRDEALETSRRATAYLRKALETAPASPTNKTSLEKHYKNEAILEREMGQFDEAATLSAERRKLVTGDADELVSVAADFAAVAAAAQLQKRTPKAQIDAWLNLALDTLHEAVEAGYADVAPLKTDTRFEPLRTLPRFKALVGRKP